MKNNRKHSFLKSIAATALILSLMTSCASADYSKTSESYSGNLTEKGLSANRSSEEFDTLTEDYYETNESITEVGRNSGEKVTEEYQDKIIRTANISMESDDAQKCYDTLLAFAKENGGREISVSKSSDTYGSYDYININAELKINPDRLNDFIALAEKTDNVTSSEVSSNDVTQDYYDIKLRLETKKEALKSYYKLLKEAGTIEEALEVQRYITDLTAEIESMEGMLKYYDSKVDLSSIHLTIRQQVRLHAGAKDDFEWDSLSFGDFITLVKNGFLSVLNILWSLLLWIIIIVIALSPLLIIAGIVLLIIRRYRKKHPKKPKAPRQALPVMNPNFIPAYPYPPQQQTNVPQNTVAAPAAPSADKEEAGK